METNRIFAASLSWLSAFVLLALPLPAQVSPQDTVTNVVPYGENDSTHVVTEAPPGDTSIITPDSLYPVASPAAIGADTIAAESLQFEKTGLTQYNKRANIAKGPTDEIKGIPDIFILNPGSVGSPAIAVEYLNVMGTEISINGLPFPCQGLYRPYVMGTDLNSIPWETLNEIGWNPNNQFEPGIDFRLGRPRDDLNRSDIDIARGPYGYEAARWRFFRPMGKKSYGYFTAGFKKSSGYSTNSDYSGFHVTGGASYKLPRGILALDLWQHKATLGLGAFDFLSIQESRQRRVIDRGELNYSVGFGGRRFIRLTGLLQRNDERSTGYGRDLKEYYTIAGGRALLSDTTKNRRWEFSMNYYRLFLSKLGKLPVVNDAWTSAGLGGSLSSLIYDLKIVYDWNDIDNGIYLPAGRLVYSVGGGISPFAQFQRSRRMPDLNILYFSDNVSGLGVGQLLQSYSFIGDRNLSMPVTDQATLGIEMKRTEFEAMAGASLKRIDSQISLAYSRDSVGNLVEKPFNYDDRLVEIFARGSAKAGPISGEISGSYRFWKDRFFPGNLEKGPAAIGFARLSFLREFFIPRLYLGGSLEARFSTRRDYRSVTMGFTDAFASLSGRLEFRYKDLTIWLNDENLTNAAFTTWWPYLETPRIVWVRFLWNFLD